MSGILKIRQAMKKKYLIAAALLAVCGCQKSNESPVVTGKADKIQAYVEDNVDTKTTATQNGKSLDFVWAKGDKIGVVTASASDEVWGCEIGKYTDSEGKPKVIYGPYEYTLEGEGGDKLGIFSSTSGTPDGDKYLAIYPYDRKAGVTRGKYVNYCYTIPIDQQYIENGFDTKYAIMYAESDSKDNMTFQHYSSVLRLNVKTPEGIFEGVKVKGIKVTATATPTTENPAKMPSICGLSYFIKSENGTTINHNNGYMNGVYNENRVINYSVPDVALSTKEVEFNIVFNPVSSGKEDKANNVVFTFEIQTDRGLITKKTKTLQVHRGVVYNMPVFEVKLAPQNVYFFNGSTTLSAPDLSSKVEGTDKFTSLTIVPNDITGKITLSETDLATISNYIKEYGSEAGVKLDLSKVYYISNIWPNTFRNNTKLQSISLPLNITDGSAAGDGDGAAPFKGCTKLSEIILDESMIRLPDQFLNGVPSIRTINLTKNVKDIIWLQSDDNTANLENITVDKDNPQLYAEKGVLYRIVSGVKELEYVPVANTAALTKEGEDYVYTLPSNVINIRQAAFHRNKNIAKIVVTNSFKKIGGGYVFGTKKLKVIDFSALNYVPEVTTAPLSLGPKGGEFWCASEAMIAQFKANKTWAKVADEARWTFKVKPAATKSQAPAISNLNSSKPDFSWK